jgi:NADH-quinone oxidoreductase subunit J
MNATFYLSGAVAVVATLLAITRAHAVHALLYLIVSLLAMGVVFFALGAPFAAALVVIINAGAIMVLFLFVIMMLNLGPHSTPDRRQWLGPKTWAGPAILSGVLALELFYCIWSSAAGGAPSQVIEPKQVGLALFGPYLLGVELASMLLLAGILGAYHLGRGVSALGKGED